MAFQSFTPTLTKRPWDHPVKAGLRKRAESSTPAKLVVTVKMIYASKWGWEDGGKLAVMIGTGEDHGKLRFKPDADGNVELKLKSLKAAEFFDVNLGCVDQFVDRPETTQGCEFKEAEDGWIEVTLPSWAEETSEKSLAKKAEARALEEKRSPAGRRKVISDAAKKFPTALSS